MESWLKYTKFIPCNRKYRMRNGGHFVHFGKFIQYISLNLYILCTKYLILSIDGFNVRSQSCCHGGGRWVETNCIEKVILGQGDMIRCILYYIYWGLCWMIYIHSILNVCFISIVFRVLPKTVKVLSLALGYFLPEANFDLRVLSLPACVCLSVCVCVRVSINHEVVRMRTPQLFQVDPPNLVKRCKTTWLRYLLFCGAIDFDLEGQI